MITPVDELTGLPLAVLPVESLAGALFYDFADNYHHHFHPKRSDLLTDAGGIALRASRGQKLPFWAHTRYHQLFTGPPLPETPQDKFHLCVLACAGFIARQAIDVSGPGDFQTVTMTDEQFEQVSLPEAWHISKAHKPDQAHYVRDAIGRFFASYVLEQQLTHVPDKVIEEFLGTQDERRRKELGNFMLKEAVEIAVEPVKPVHVELGRQGLRHANRRDPSPASVVRNFFTKDRFTNYHSELSRRLLQQAA